MNTPFSVSSVESDRSRSDAPSENGRSADGSSPSGRLAILLVDDNPRIAESLAIAIDLAGHRLIHYAPLLGQRAAGFEWQDAQGVVHVVPMAGGLTVNNSEAYIGACLAGLGLVQVPRRGNDGEVENGRLREVLPDHRAAPMPVHLLYPHRRQLPRRVQVFMQWLAELMAPRLIPLFSGGSIGHPDGSSTAA